MMKVNESSVERVSFVDLPSLLQLRLKFLILPFYFLLFTFTLFICVVQVSAQEPSLNEIARGEFELPRLREREAACAASADLQEGLAAFAARRTPRFQGR